MILDFLKNVRRPLGVFHSVRPANMISNGVVQRQTVGCLGHYEGETKDLS